MRPWLFVPVLALFLTIAASPVFSQSVFTLSGRVTSSAGPVAGATVTYEIIDVRQGTIVSSFVVSTSVDGSFSAKVPAGRVHLLVAPPSGTNLLADQIFNIDVTSDVFINIPLNRPVRIAGKVVAVSGTNRRGTIEAFSLSTNRQYSVQSTDGSFDIQVVADRYSIQFGPQDSALAPASTTVDARSGDLLNIVISAGTTPSDFVPKEPPKAALISIGTADASGVATVRGQPGSVAPTATVLVANLQTGQVNPVVSESDGSFVASMFAPPGSFIEVKHDPSGRYLNRFFPSMEVPPGTIIYVAPDPQTLMAVGAMREPASDIRLLPFLGAPDPGEWLVSAPFDAQQWNLGQRFSLSGTLTLWSNPATDEIYSMKVERRK